MSFHLLSLSARGRWVGHEDFLLWCTCIRLPRRLLCYLASSLRADAAVRNAPNQRAAQLTRWHRVARGGKTRWGGCATADLGLASADARFICTAWRRQKALSELASFLCGRSAVLDRPPPFPTAKRAPLQPLPLPNPAFEAIRRSRSYTLKKHTLGLVRRRANLIQRCCATLLDVQRGGGGSRHTHACSASCLQQRESNT